MDAIGVRRLPDKCRKKVALCRRSSRKCWPAAKGFYESEKGTTTVFDIGSVGRRRSKSEGRHHSQVLKDAAREVDRNSGASLIDLGDGVVCCEFHAR